VTRLSSRSSPFLKWGLPILWLLVFAGVGVAAWMQPHADVGALVMVCVMPVFLAVVYRFQIWPLADAVDDAGDALRIRRRGVELRIPLADIVNVSSSRHSRSRRITLRLRRAGTRVHLFNYSAAPTDVPDSLTGQVVLGQRRLEPAGVAVIAEA